ncbi:hypothetical protein [Nostoc sp. JL33]|uniref:hypothetical protein n=1 Tax=Nostoc sp. JL33 TaxID=2815396 RepID=UPI0025F4955F|nr:hypothetical protein [Nostoc sp. JL33]
MKIKGILALVVGVGALASALTTVIASNIGSASAIPYNSATVYKATDAGSTVVVFSATAGSRIAVSLGSEDKSTARLAGSCGELRISVPSTGSFTGLKVDGVAVNAATLSVQTLPSCVSGAFAEARTTNFKTATGQVVIVGKTAGSAVAVSLPSATTRNVTANACGFGILKGTSTSPLPATFMVGATNYTVATLPDATTAPYCRTIDGTPFGYVPASW